MIFDSNESSHIIRTQRSNKNLERDGVDSDSQKQERQEDGHHNYIIAPGELREKFNKRSESANRKYRAFKHFLKYQSNTNKSKRDSNLLKNSS